MAHTTKVFDCDLQELARAIAEMGGLAERQITEAIEALTTVMLAQLGDVLDSFARRDVAKAVEVWTRDQHIDKLCTSLSQQLLADMIENPIGASLGAHLMFCTKNLERMGDHATNIAEAVHYMVKGETLLRERPKADFTSMLTGAPVFALLTARMMSGESATNSAAYL